MKHQNLQKQIAAFVAVVFFVVALLVSLVVVSMPLAPQASAETGRNILQEMGEKCEKMSKGSDLWKACENAQAQVGVDDPTIQRRGLGCDDKMFFAKQDPLDSSVDLDEWYTRSGKYAECYGKAQNKLTKIKEECKTMKHGSDGDSDKWKECELEQIRLHQTLGCSDRMFRKKTNTHFELDPSAADDCQKRVDAVGSVRVMQADGSLADPAKDTPEAASTTGGGDGEGGGKQVDCDTKLSSILSWIACPLVDTGAGMTDFVFQDIIEPLLQNVPVSTNQDHGSYDAWQQFRLLANIILVGTLLAIVYSQARGGGK